MNSYLAAPDWVPLCSRLGTSSDANLAPLPPAVIDELDDLLDTEAPSDCKISATVHASFEEACVQDCHLA